MIRIVSFLIIMMLATMVILLLSKVDSVPKAKLDIQKEEIQYQGNIPDKSKDTYLKVKYENPKEKKNFQKNITNKSRDNLQSFQKNMNKRNLQADNLEISADYLPSPIKSLAVGKHHTCVVNNDGQVICWGLNTFGQLGTGTSIAIVKYANNAQIIDIGDGRVAEKVVVGFHHTLVLLESGDVISWGQGTSGQLGTGSSINTGKTKSQMGNNLKFIDVGSGRKVKKISADYHQSCFILDNNTLKCCGVNNYGQLGYGDKGNRGISVSHMGDKLPIVDLGDNAVVKDISVGWLHICALLENNEAKCWGNNSSGQLGYEDKVSRTSPGPIIDFGRPVKEIHAGYDFSCAILDNDKVKCYGKNTNGVLGTGIAGDKGGTAGDMGDNLPYSNFGAGVTVKKLFLNGISPCALLSDDRVKCWGEICFKGYGDTIETVGDKLPAMDFGAARKVKEISGYTQAYCASFEDNSFSCWGKSDNYRSGRGTTITYGCVEGEMGNNLPSISLECHRNKLSIGITTEEHSNSISTEVKHLNTDSLVMKGREGFYSMEAQIYTHELCVPDGTFEFKIKHSLGNWSGSYEIKFKENIIYEQDPQGYFWQDQHIFSSCSSEYHCNDQFSCTFDTCDADGSVCQFRAHFSDSCRTYGSPKILVIRSLTLDSNTSSSLQDLNTRFYGDGEHLSMRSQILDCSYDRFDLVPYEGYSSTNMIISNGTTDISIEEFSVGSSASKISSKILEKAANELGELSSQFDFVIVCLPPGTVIGDSPFWKAYAFVDGYISIYNDLNCIYPSVQMHEIGHNVGLSHSNDEENYGDTSGAMGISYSLLDGPAKCFNAPKSLQLQWYQYGELILDVATLIGKEVQLVGITDYLDRGFKSTHLKIINCENGYDYFLSLNRKDKMNRGTNEGEDQILISRRRVGNYYDDSKLIAKLKHLQRYTIFGLGPKGDWDLQIMPNIFLEESLSYGQISFSVLSQQCLDQEDCNDQNFCTRDECTLVDGDMICLNTPKSCSDCGATLYLEVVTNDYPLEILWDIQNVNTKQIVKSSAYYTDVFSSYNFSDCFEYGMYIFSIYYANSTDEFYRNATFKLSIGDEVMDTGNITEMIYGEVIFTICSKDSDCLDYDGCTIDICDIQTRLCNNTYIPLSEECIDCFWAYFNLTTDNFADETKWNLLDSDTGLLVEMGDPYPSYFHAFGRRKAPTKSGRRKAPTKSGRRKAPTKSGRRKAPTRSSALAILNELSRNLDEEEDNEIFKAICLETNIKYKYFITDSFGDGICCAEGEGSYAVILEDKIIKQGGNFSSYEEVEFKFTSEKSSCEDNNPSTYFKYDPDIKACLYYPVDCSVFGAMVTVLIRSDIYAGDTIWEVTKNGTNVMQGGMYELAYTEYENDKCLTYGSYSFNIKDPPADGMAFCFDNECGYELIVNNQTIQVSDGSFSATKAHVFGICVSDEQCNDDDVCTVDSCDMENKICIYNPLSCSECNKQTVVVDINTDVLFSLTSWDITESKQNISVASGGPYVKSYTHYQHNFCLSNGTYEFQIRNSEGRGMTICRQGYNCGYKITVNNESVIESDGSFEHEKDHSFVICERDMDCNNGDPCVVGQCNNDTKLCRYKHLPCADCDKKALKIVVDTDANASETSWSLINAQNKLLLSSGGKYAKNYSRYTYDDCVPKGEYLFTIYDQNGNGFASCDNNLKSCGYSLVIENSTVFDSTGNFNDELSHSFKLCDDDLRCNKITSTFIPTPSPTLIPMILDLEYLDIQSFAVGFYHTCALTTKGLIFCFGSNDFGQLGYGDNLNRYKTGNDLPALDIGDSYRAKDIFAGAFHTCVLLIDDDLSCFGDNRFGQLGIESTINIGLRTGQMGNSLKIIDFGMGRKVKHASLGYFHSCALLDDDSIKCWGNNEYGQLGYGNTDNIGDNKGEMGDSLTSVDLGSAGIINDLSAGTYHTCVLQANQVKCFGKNSNGQLGYGDEINRGDVEDTMGNKLPFVDVGGDSIQVSAGNSFTCIVLDNNTSKCFGYNKFGQLGYGDKIERGRKENEMGDFLPSLDIGDDFKISYITTGSYSVCALSTNTSVKCWGWNYECTLAMGDNIDRFSSLGDKLPSLDFGNREVKEIKMFHWHACALFEDGTIFCFGFNRYGQLGQGHFESIGCNSLDMGDPLDLVQLVEAEDWKIQLNYERSKHQYNNLGLVYDISRNVGNEQFIANIFDKACSISYNTTSINIQTELKDTSNNIFQEGHVYVQIDYRSIKSSDLWTPTSNSTGSLNFCIKTELLLNNESNASVSFVETLVSADLNMGMKFANFEISNITLGKEYISNVKKEKTLVANGCLCNLMLECLEDPKLTQNSYVILCVMGLGSNVEVQGFDSVSFYQDGILKFSPVMNNENMELTSTISGAVGVMQTRMLSMFFDAENPSNLFIKGTVILKFKDRRLLQNMDLAQLESKESANKAVFRLQVSLLKKKSAYMSQESFLLACVLILLFLGYIISRRKKNEYNRLPTEDFL